MLAAVCGWFQSIPVSRAATTTSCDPSVMSQASYAFTVSRPHWRDVDGSLGVTLILTLCSEDTLMTPLASGSEISTNAAEGDSDDTVSANDVGNAMKNVISNARSMYERISG